MHKITFIFIYAQPLFYAFFALTPLYQFSALCILRFHIFCLTPFWLAAFFYAEPLFLMGISFFDLRLFLRNATRA